MTLPYLNKIQKNSIFLQNLKKVTLTGELIFSNCSSIALVLLLSDEAELVLDGNEAFGFITNEVDGMKEEAKDWFKLLRPVDGASVNDDNEKNDCNENTCISFNFCIL